MRQTLEPMHQTAFADVHVRACCYFWMGARLSLLIDVDCGMRGVNPFSHLTSLLMSCVYEPVHVSCWVLLAALRR